MSHLNLKTKWMACIVHELRNPLTVIQGSAELLETSDPLIVKKTAHLIGDATLRMEKILQALLRFVEMDAKNIHKEPIFLLDLFESCQNRLKTLYPQAHFVMQSSLSSPVIQG